MRLLILSLVVALPLGLLLLCLAQLSARAAWDQEDGPSPSGPPAVRESRTFRTTLTVLVALFIAAGFAAA